MWTRLVGILALVAVPVLVGVPVSDAASPANVPFNQSWSRTDGPVAAGQTSRTWMWGPSALSGGFFEDYAESPNGTRLVQYFDKSRMEITNPNAVDDGVWFVTNGLLVRELITGQMQLGDSQFVQESPADVGVAGDPDDTSGPTYAALAGLLDAPAAADGATLTQRIDREGNVTNDPSLASMNVTAGNRVQVPGIDHQIATPFWNFMNSSGVVYQDGGFVTAQLFVNPFYATGFPITEAYWANVKVAGTVQLVLLQCFERRCLTYTPGNPAGWQVEAGNVGQHYYEWRYAGRVSHIAFTAPLTLSSTVDILSADGSTHQSMPVDGLIGSVRWSPDGTRLLFVAAPTDYRQSDIFVMAADGSNRVNLTPVDASVSYADWSPDGTRIVYTSRTVGNQESQLYAMNADGTHVVQLTDVPFSAINPVWSPDGARIAFTGIGVDETGLTREDMWVIDADGANLRRITDGCQCNSPPVWAPDSERIAYRDFHLTEDIYTVRTDGSDRVNLTATESWYEDQPTWSPDGSRIAFTRRDPSGKYASDIWVMDADGSNPVQLTDNPADDTNPSWSPDGTHIAFGTLRDVGERNGDDEVYVMDADGGNQTRLTDDLAENAITDGQGIAWSPDGIQIALASFVDPSGDIWIIDEHGAGLVDLTQNPAEENFPSWSPDGRKLAFVSHTLRLQGSSLYVVDLATGGISPVVTDPTLCANAASWSPDSARLVFAADIGCDNDSGSDALFVVDVDGSHLTNISGGVGIDDYPAWSPTGDQIAFVSFRGGVYGMYLMAPDGTNVHRIETGSVVPQNGGPVWSPDGTRVAWLGYDAANQGVYARQEVFSAWVNGSGVQNLTNNALEDTAFAWSPHGDRIVVFANDEESSGSTRMSIIDVSTGESTTLADVRTSGYWLTWSPDGAFIAWPGVYDVDTDQYFDDIFIMPAAGGEPTMLTEGMDLIEGIVWSPGP